MLFSLSPFEFQAIAVELKEYLLPLLASAAEIDRGSMKMLSVDEVAANAGVVRKTVENWITAGKFRAVANWGTDKRPMYRVSVAAYWEFYDSNPALIRNARGRGGPRKR